MSALVYLNKCFRECKKYIMNSQVIEGTIFSRNQTAEINYPRADILKLTVNKRKGQISCA